MDSDTAVALQSKAYEVLNTYFHEHTDELLNIEILPPVFPPPDGICVQEESNLGVPKKILALAFVEARKRFLANANDGPTSVEAFQATRLILLFDPEYLTAANFRKRRLDHLKSASAQNIFQREVDRELIFLTTILTSPLHRQTKSPTLWHHRFLLVAHHLLPTYIETDILGLLQSELSVVCKSGERHPKNYYAFQYARRFFTASLFPPQGLSPPPRCATSLADKAIADAVEVMRDWCCRHPSDISGFSFLGWLLRRCEDVFEKRRVVEKIVGYALRARFSNESLWYFVRIVVADETVGEGRTNILGLLLGWLSERGGREGGVLDERVRQTVDWIEKYALPQPTTTVES